MRLNSGWPMVFVVAVLGLVGLTSAADFHRQLDYACQEASSIDWMSECSSQTVSCVTPVAAQGPSNRGSLKFSPFHTSGAYRSPDIAIDYATTNVSQPVQDVDVTEKTSDRDRTNDSANHTYTDSDILDLPKIAAPDVERMVPNVHQASAPMAAPRKRLKSEVVVRPRPIAQPIGELAIAEWSPLSAWPKPTALVQRLEEFKQYQETAQWADYTIHLLKVLNSSKQLDDPEHTTVFQHLNDQLYRLNQIVVSVSTIPVQQPDHAQGEFANALRTLHYDIARRLMIWMYVAEAARNTQNQLFDLDQPQVTQLILTSQSKFTAPGMGEQWSQYLGFDELESAFNALTPDADAQRDAARLTMARLYSPSLSNAQREYLSQNISDELLQFLRSKATDQVELTELMKILEKHEADATGYTSDRLNDVYQSLLWSTDPSAQDLAAQLDGHYRNANFRVSVSDELINRLLPQTPEIQQPIHENVMGAQIDGNSRINNRLFIRLIPDNRKVNLRLEANGWVRSLTQARRSGFVVDNVGVSRFQVFKRLAIHRNGVETDVPYAVSDTNSQIVGMRSNLDPIPIVGWVARQIAHNKIEESAPMTDHYTRRKVESSAKEQIETEVQTHLDQVREYLMVNMLQPLIALELEPTPIEMKTTEERVIMRYRLAGRDHMASHTVRPRALSQSLMSVQFHESTFNNLFDRIELRGQSYTAEELTRHLKDVFRSDQAIGSDEVNHEANFEFAPYDPIRLEFKEERIELSVNLKRFRVGKGKTWKNLSVRATYFPEVRGSKLRLVRDKSGIRLKGSNLKLRDQVAVRAVFTALFRDHYDWNVLPQKFQEKFNSTQLEISQLVINDGWIGLSLSDAINTAKVPPIRKVR